MRLGNAAGDGGWQAQTEPWETQRPRDRITGVRRKATIAYRDVFSSYIYVPNDLDEQAQYFHISFPKKKLWWLLVHGTAIAVSKVGTCFPDPLLWRSAEAREGYSNAKEASE